MPLNLPDFVFAFAPITGTHSFKTYPDVSTVKKLALPESWRSLLNRFAREMNKSWASARLGRIPRNGDVAVCPIFRKDLEGKAICEGIESYPFKWANSDCNGILPLVACLSNLKNSCSRFELAMQYYHALSPTTMQIW